MTEAKAGPLASDICPLASVVAAADAWVGVPWRHQGRSREGIDCLGLLIVVARDLGLDQGVDVTAPEFRNYRRLPPAGLATELAKHLDRAGEIAPGRIGLFALPGSAPAHVAIFGDWGDDRAGGACDIIHAYMPHQAVVRHKLDPSWRTALRAIFEYRGTNQ